MAKKHWQIVKHDTGGKPLEGGFKSFSLAQVPPLVLDTGLRAASAVGDGLYGVDLKETDEVWTRLTNWFIERIAV